MKGKTALLLCLMLLLTGCIKKAEYNTSAPEVSQSDHTGEKDKGQNISVDTYAGQSPLEESITDPWQTMGMFEIPGEAVTTTRETYTICEGTLMEAEVVVLTAKEPGPIIYIVASVHGNEIAAYTAADQLKNMELASGTLYILSPANTNGTREFSRYVVDKQDLNRAFPGKADGTEAEQLAWAIYSDIDRVQPMLLLDLHEALVSVEDRDFLGSSLIYTTLDGIDDMFLNMHQATQDRKLCSEAFSFYGPGPVGSINNVISTELGIPAITIETYRAYLLERRVEDQLALIGYVLNYYGIV